MLCFPTSLIQWFCTTLRNRKPRNCIFPLQHCMLLCQQSHKTHSNYLLVAVEPTIIPKVIDCMRQTIKTYLEREHSILLSVIHTLYVYQVCRRVGRCVKDWSCSSSSLEWKSTDSINGYLTILTNVRRYQTHHRWHFLLSGRQRIGAHTLCMQHSPTVATLSTSFLLNHAPNSPELNALITRFRESCSSMSMSHESKRLVEFWQLKNTIFVFHRVVR